jgi:nitroreductase
MKYSSDDRGVGDEHSDPRVAEIIRTRRSVRGGFTSRPVPVPVLDEIIQCGLAAPSSKNAQPWRLHVVTNAPTLQHIAAVVEEAGDDATYVPIDPATGDARPDWPTTVAESASILRQVPLAIFVENRGEFSSGRKTIAEASRSHLESALVGYSLEAIGLGAAIQNMLLAASAQGLGAVFMGDVLIAEQAIRSRLDMTGDLAGVVACGYVTDQSIKRDLRGKPDRVVFHD